MKWFVNSTQNRFSSYSQHCPYSLGLIRSSRLLGNRDGSTKMQIFFTSFDWNLHALACGLLSIVLKYSSIWARMTRSQKAVSQSQTFSPVRCWKSNIIRLLNIDQTKVSSKSREEFESVVFKLLLNLNCRDLITISLHIFSTSRNAMAKSTSTWDATGKQNQKWEPR